MIKRFQKKHNQQGMTLIELLVAIAIGAILLAGLASIFFNSSRSQRELSRSGELIENGRYAVNILENELRHVGYYGQFYDIGDSTGTLPDPCTTTLSDIEDNMVQPLSGYTAPDASTRADVSGTSCDDLGLLVDDNLVPGTDVLVVMRASTETSNTSTINGEVYLEANALEINMFIGNGSAPTSTLEKYPTKPTATDDAEIRPFIVHTYFVAPCVIGNNADGTCDGSEDYMPTLKRLELSSKADDAVPDIVITPLVEGIEKFLVEYGIDDNPATVDDVTGEPGDGIPDLYVAEPTTAQWPNVITARVHILARTTEASDDHTDDKQYELAGLTYGPYNDAFKRHVFVTEVRPVNIAGRREIPE